MTSKSAALSHGSRMAAAGLKQSRQAQDRLEEAVSAVMKAEQQLRDNARQVRGELQSCVSRQQEALRCREVWLLGQIELLEQVKAETLQTQLHQLHRLRGQFDVITQQLQTSNSNDLSNQLTSCMEKLSSLSLTPEETPEMSFRADTRSLRQAITSFGCITAQLMEGVASQSPTPHRATLTSCPIAAKKKRTEGGALEEWLLGARPVSSGPVGYQASKKTEDWLMDTEVKAPCPVLASVDFLKAWGQLRDLEAWLHQDQGPIRDRTNSCASSTGSSSFSIEKIDESELEMEEEQEEELEEDELSGWLLTPSCDPSSEDMTDAEHWQKVLKPFEESWSSSDWLAGPSRPPASCTSCPQTGRAVEIENLGQLKCLKTPPPSPTDPAPDSLDAWLQRAAPLERTCRANEACPAYSHCVCEDNCGKEALSLWLLQQDGRDKNGVPVDKNKQSPPAKVREQEHKVQAILEAWLHPSKALPPTSKTPPPCRSPLQVLGSSSLSSWVAPGEEKASREESSSSPFLGPLVPDLWVPPQKKSKPRPPEENDKWLAKKSQTQECLALPSVCELFSCMKLGRDTDQWLHSAPPSTQM